MPLLRRPDGVELHWEEHGEGPTVVVCNTFNLSPIAGLVEALAGNRRVIVYDPRGVGRSARRGPYDMVTGVLDLEGLLEGTGPAAAALGIGDGSHRAAKLAAARPDLLDRVVVTSTTLGPGTSTREGFAGSGEVLEALVGMMERDYRSGIRSMVAGSQPEEDAIRERVEKLVESVPQDAAVGYLRAWIEAESAQAARLLGPRLTILAYPGNSWFPLAAFESMRGYLPAASFVQVDDGPMTRPDQAADILLRASAATG